MSRAHHRMADMSVPIGFGECIGSCTHRDPPMVLKTGVMSEWRKLFEAKDSDFGGGALVPWKCVFFHWKWVPQVPRIWERETTDPKPTEADHDQSR